jgi:ribosomal protein L15
MEEIKKSGRGGRREGAGRHKRVESQKVLFYFEKGLYDAFPKSINRNAYINEAVREKMKKDGYIK